MKEKSHIMSILPSDSHHNKKVSQKRNYKEIQSLVDSLKKHIKKSYELKQRVNYFFSSDDILNQLLFRLCKFIPKDEHILDIRDQSKQNSDEFQDVGNSENDSWIAPNSDFDNISVHEYDENGSRIVPNSKWKEKRTNAFFNSCVEWKGYVNEANGYATVRISVPFIYKEYYTYVNRLVFFLFQKTNITDIESFLQYHKFINKKIPLYMKCNNKLCVKLSHIDASNDLYI